MPLKKRGSWLGSAKLYFWIWSFFLCFSRLSSATSSSHNVSWLCLHNPGWRSLSKALHWGMEIEHIVQVPWLIICSDNNHSNNKKLDLFLLLGSRTALGRKHFWNYTFIKIWENIRGGTQGSIFHGTLRDLFSFLFSSQFVLGNNICPWTNPQCNKLKLKLQLNSISTKVVGKSGQQRGEGNLWNVNQNKSPCQLSHLSK